MDEAEPKVLFGTGQEDFRQAEWLAHVLKKEWRYDHVNAKWHGWNGVRWAEDKTNKITNRVAYLAARKLPKSETEAERKALAKLLSIASINKALEALATFEGYGTDGSDWDQNPYLLGCHNGIVDLRDGRLITKPDPSTLVTKTTGHDYEPFDPGDNLGQAMMERAPHFTRFLLQVTGLDDTTPDASMASFLLVWFGASLFGMTPEQRFLLMTGIGRNGKGALKHSVMKAVGEYGAQPDANLYSRSKMGPARSDGARADLMALKGKRITFFSEPDRGQFNEEMLKAHTGGDEITARALYSNDIVQWSPTHSITFLVNDAPSIEDVGPSMAARVMVADFRNRYDGDKEDKGLYGKLEKESAGVLAILVWYATQWYESWSSGEGGIALPERVTQASQSFVERNDPIAQWLSAACEEHPTYTTPSQIAHDEYMQWHARNDQEGDPMNATRFAAALLKKGFTKQKKERGVVWSGFRPLAAVRLAMREASDGE